MVMNSGLMAINGGVLMANSELMVMTLWLCQQFAIENNHLWWIYP